MLRVCVLLAVTSFVCGCAEPLPPPAKIAARIDLSEASCLGGGSSSVPNARDVQLKLQDEVTDLESFPYVIDGESGGKAHCSVVETGAASFTLDASAQAGGNSFSVQGSIVNGVGSGVAISWNDAVKFTDAIVGKGCSLTLRQSTEGGGAALASFDCPSMASSKQPTAVCKGVGTFILSRCDK